MKRSNLHLHIVTPACWQEAMAADNTMLIPYNATCVPTIAPALTHTSTKECLHAHRQQRQDLHHDRQTQRPLDRGQLTAGAAAHRSTPTRAVWVFLRWSL